MIPTPSTTDDMRPVTVALSLLAVDAAAVPDAVDVDRIAEDAAQAAFRCIYDALQAAEGFARYGDATPSEVDSIARAFRLMVRSALANGPVARV